MVKRIFSGIQPTGSLHIGNYLGAMVNFLALQETREAIYCVVDYHALTIRPDPDQLRDRVRHVGLGYLAAGIDPEKAILFRQSDVPEHAELAWILGCFTQIGELSKMTQFKDKARQHKENVNAGLFTYPVLQAADILLYKAEEVPVGEDQAQHLELSRDIARRFNNHYGPTFPEPATLLSQAPRVLGLDGEQKMSKSKNNEIGILDPPEVIQQKLRIAKTDEARQRRTDPGEPTRCNVFTWHTFFTPDAEREELAKGCREAGIGCVDCKKVLFERMNAVLAPIRERHEELKAKGWEYVDQVLLEGGRKARAIAGETMKEVREKVGLLPEPGGGA